MVEDDDCKVQQVNIFLTLLLNYYTNKTHDNVVFEKQKYTAVTRKVLVLYVNIVLTMHAFSVGFSDVTIKPQLPQTSQHEALHCANCVVHKVGCVPNW